MLIRGSGQNCSKGLEQSQNVSFKESFVIKLQKPVKKTILWDSKIHPAREFDEFIEQDTLKRALKSTKDKPNLSTQVKEYMELKFRRTNKSY